MQQALNYIWIVVVFVVAVDKRVRSCVNFSGAIAAAAAHVCTHAKNVKKNLEKLLKMTSKHVNIKRTQYRGGLKRVEGNVAPVFYTFFFIFLLFTVAILNLV